MADRKYKSITIVHHTYTISSLVEEELRAYLLPKTERIDYLTLPFKSARDGVPPHARTQIYKNGKLEKTIKGPKGFGPEPFYFIRDFFYAVGYVWSLREKPTIFFGVDNLNAFTGIWLRFFGKVDRVVYYVIDYVPQRFANPVLNSIYRAIDRFCVKHANQTWNLGSAMAVARTQSGLPKKYEANQITVPVGTHLAASKHQSLAKVKTIKLVFLGILNEDQGIDRLIESLPGILKKNPTIHLSVIGSGPLADQLKQRASELKIDPAITWHGYIKTNAEVDQILATCHLGLAPYRVTPTSFKHYTDPGKIKTYLGAGLPIVMTRISHIADILEKEKAGLVAGDSPASLERAINKVLSDAGAYEALSNNASRLAKQYQWSTIFDQAFNQLEHEK